MYDKATRCSYSRNARGAMMWRSRRDSRGCFGFLWRPIWIIVLARHPNCRMRNRNKTLVPSPSHSALCVYLLSRFRTFAFSRSHLVRRWWACDRLRSLVPPSAVPFNARWLAPPARRPAFLVPLLPCSFRPPRGPPKVEKQACR